MQDALLAREKGQILPRRGGFDSEDAEEYTESRRGPAEPSGGGGKKSSHLSESEDAEESRHDARTLAEMHDTSEAEEYSYIGGGGGWSRSESGTSRLPTTAGARPLPAVMRHSSLSKASELDDRDDGISEEVSVSESLVAEKKGGPKHKYANKSYEESTDAESASESEVPLKE